MMSPTKGKVLKSIASLRYMWHGWDEEMGSLAEQHGQLVEDVCG